MQYMKKYIAEIQNITKLKRKRKETEEKKTN